MKLLHIGLGKCGSTLLQQEIFPKISKLKNISYIDIVKKLNTDKTKIKYHILENQNNFEKELPDNFILSYEGLFSHKWEFSRVFNSFEIIKKNFSSDTVVLIILRNPYELLNSIYCQSIQKAKILKPENFFYINNDEEVRKDYKFNLYNFDYIKLISLYKSYFKKVIITKYEKLNDFSFLSEIFDLKDSFIREIKNRKRKIYNKSISSYGIKTFLALNNLINLEKNQQLIFNNIKQTDNPFLKLKNKILSQLILRDFFQNKFDKIIPYKKYNFKKQYIPIDIDKMTNDYNNMKL